MNADDVDRMEAGDEMDEAVATLVMGISVTTLNESTCPYCGGEMYHCATRSRCSYCNEWRYTSVKEYSTDIAAAWEVLSHFIDSMPGIHVSRREGEWHVQLYGGCLSRTFEAKAATEMLAICRAALKAALASSREPGKVETGRKE